MNRTVLLLLGLAGLLPILLFGLSQTETTPNRAAARPLSIFCAASNQAVMESIASDYRDEFATELFINYGASQGLLSQIELSGTGDLFLPADASYLETARAKSLVADVFPIAVMKVIVVVAPGNPKKIRTWEDLLRSDVRLVQANPDAAAVGHVTRSTLRKLKKWESLDRATTAYRGNVTEVANDVAIGSADAGLVYDAMMFHYPALESVELPELETAVSEVAVGIVARSKNRARAEQFVEYLRSEEHGRRRYREHGFRVSEN